MTADSITADNEREHDPKVEVTEISLNNFTDGFETDLPPHSLTVLSWQE
jgi:hypothetical protein